MQRLLCGAGVDQMEILINGDYHEFHFSGLAQGRAGQRELRGRRGQLQSFPAEPALDGVRLFDRAGTHGAGVAGDVAVAVLHDHGRNGRGEERAGHADRGSSDRAAPRAISPGQRSVTAAFDLYSQDDDATKELYQAARQQSPISVMFQLGEADGPVDGRVSEERGSGGAGVRRRREPAAVEIPGVAGAGDDWTMKFPWRSDRAATRRRGCSYDSEAVVESRVVAGSEVHDRARCRSGGGWN